MKKIIILFLINLSVHGFVYAQTADNDSKSNISVSSTVSTDQLEFLVPYWISNKLTIAPVIGVPFKNAYRIQSPFLVVELKRYFRNPVGVVPYAVVNGGYSESVNGFLGIGLGAEYFLNPNFSIGAELTSRFSFRHVSPKKLDLTGYEIEEVKFFPGLTFNLHF